jgi:hypothetical protein
MAPKTAALAIEGALGPTFAGSASAASPSSVTIADAAAKSGLPLRDAERGLHHLTTEYRGHLRVTSEGELLFLFPSGFRKPWETRDVVDRAIATTGRAIGGAARFVVRAWLTIILLAYAAIFFAVLIGTMVAQRGDGRGRGKGFEVGFVLIRVLVDALYWTFHPFSPLNVGYAPRFERARRFREAPRDEAPFYEKVNRFFFGPTPAKIDPLAEQKKIVALIRAKKGRVGLADVMRATGLPREKADPLMARLMLDYDGDVEVSEGGGITYRFSALRKTAIDADDPPPAPAWSDAKDLPPLTGNGYGANFAIAALNAFNLVMSLVAIDAGLTLDKLPFLFGRIPLAALPYTGVPIVLGIVPLVMSAVLFALPIARAALRPLRRREIEQEKARLSVLRTVVSNIEAKKPVTDQALVRAWKDASGATPESIDVTRAVLALGGDAEVQESGEVRYRFPELEAEEAALEDERARASDEEKRTGNVVFASDE